MIKKSIQYYSKKLQGSLLFILLFAVICGFFFAQLIAPDREFSENENKYLATPPKFTWKSLVDGKFASRYEEYICDQFLFRDEWIEIKSVSEYALLKTENNGVAYGKDGYMFPKLYSFDEKKLNKNLEAIDAFAYDAPVPVSVMVVPSAFYPLADKVPAGLPTVDEGFFIDEINGYLSVSAKPLNIKDELCVHNDEYIYYRTDHHWTTYGAWLAYSVYAKSLGYTPVDYDALTPKTVDGFLGTSYSKCKAFNALPDVITYFPSLDGTLVNGETPHDSLYNLEQFAKRDKYSGFLFGNSSYVEVRSEYSDAKDDSLLIIRDSYADSFTPFLTEHYNKIVLVDPRYYKGDYSELARQNFTDILILFGFEDLCSETTITNLRPAQ